MTASARTVKLTSVQTPTNSPMARLIPSRLASRAAKLRVVQAVQVIPKGLMVPTTLPEVEMVSLLAGRSTLLRLVARVESHR